MNRIFFILLTSFLFTQCSVSKNNSSTQPKKLNENEQQEIAVSKNNQEKQLNGIWHFEYFTMNIQNVNLLFPFSVPTLNFDIKNKQFSGTTGCNNISGKIMLNADKIQFIEPIMMTRMSCNARGEAIFVEYLKQIQSYSIEGQILKLIGLEGKPYFIMKR